MIIDAHTHICSPEVRQNRAEYFRPGVAAFTAMYQDPKSRLAGASDLVGMLDEEGVDMAVSFGFPWSKEETARAENDYVLEAMGRFPGRIIGLACLDPLQPWAEREALRALEAGARGLGELGLYDRGFDQESIKRFVSLGQICREKDVPLLVHVNEPIGHQYPGRAPLTLPMIFGLVKALEGVKLILAHWGGGLFFYNLLKKEVPPALTGVYFDTAASVYLYQPAIYELAAAFISPEKILFGSDFPLVKPGRYFREMEEAGLSPSTAILIKGESAARLFIRK